MDVHGGGVSSCRHHKINQQAGQPAVNGRATGEDDCMLLLPSQRSLTGLRSHHVLRALASLDLSGKWQAARAVHRILDWEYYTSMQ
jgi:hypothetical protein